MSQAFLDSSTMQYLQTYIFFSQFNKFMFALVISMCNLCAVWLCAKSLQSCLTLCNRMDCSSPGSSVHGILQARILEWVVLPSPGGHPDPGIECVSLRSPVLTGGFFTTSAAWEALLCGGCSVAQSCLTLCDPGLQHTRSSCPSPSPRAFSNSCH